ncbi:MAG: cytochrome c oxidase assembly protein [Proteobacteria bacterium]|jgi:cytochrome c oxidase assembly protein subunit 11|nr:cytochrome c oxidase assembly protein [Pseudomonadota bacterium]
MSERENRRLLVRLGAVAVAMFGFGYALVPLYYTVCDALGLRDLGRPDAVVNTQVDATRTVRVQFDTNVRSMGWQFTALERTADIHPGAVTQAVFRVVNSSGRAVTGQAIPSYAPRLAGEYFRKVECFCFQRQTLAPGETRLMPVVFVIDPGLPHEVATITLSYTFFEVEGTGDGQTGA